MEEAFLIFLWLADNHPGYIFIAIVVLWASVWLNAISFAGTVFRGLSAIEKQERRRRYDDNF